VFVTPLTKHALPYTHVCDMSHINVYNLTQHTSTQVNSISSLIWSTL